MDSYEKKYKEALEVAKRKLCFGKAGMVDSFTPNDIYEMFPELKESEDEKIREHLIKHFGNKSKTDWNGMPVDKIIAWLEKQGVQPRYNIGDVICDKSCTTLNKEAQPNMEIVDIQNGMYICDKGSFPVSQQDEYVLVSKKIDTKLNDDSVSNELREASTKHAENELKNQTFPDNLEFELVYTFEEGAKWDAAQKRTWSKDDDNNIGMIESRLTDLLSYTREDNSLTKHRKNSIKEEVVEYVNWLTSLKDRSTWKPSGVQMTVLDDVIINGHLPNANEKILKGLQEQLRKLK